MVIPILKVAFSRRAVDRLGVSMYTGGLVATLSELIANAWDADAKNVIIEAPFGQEVVENSEIKIIDDGHGMTASQCNDYYLKIGYDRRKEHGDYTASGKRLVMGKKGVGKFSMFGIANIVEIFTVCDGELTHFRLEYDKLVEDDDTNTQYEPILLEYKNGAKLNNQTIITLKNIKMKQITNLKTTHASIGRRFNKLGSKYNFIIETHDLSSKEMNEIKRIFPNVVLNFPENTSPETPEEEIDPDLGLLRYWIGFTEKPIESMDTYYRRGISVITRGRMANIEISNPLIQSGYGNAGLPKMIGEIEADIFDEVECDDDLISTNRESINWHSEKGKKFQSWLDGHTKDALRKWVDHIRAKTPKYVEETEEIQKLLSSIPKSERNYIEKVVNGYAKNVFEKSDDPEVAKETVIEFTREVSAASQDQMLVRLIDSIAESEKSSEMVPELMKLIRKWDLLELFKLGKIIRGRAVIAKAFMDILDPSKDVTEDLLRKFIVEHPWILQPTWIYGRGETGLTTIFRDEFKFQEDVKKLLPKKAHRKSVDMLLPFYNGKDFLIVEFKKRGIIVTLEEADQIVKYVIHLQTNIPLSPISSVQNARIAGMFIAEDFDTSARTFLQTNNIEYFTWSEHELRLQAWFDEILGAISEEKLNNPPEWDDDEITPDKVIFEIEGKKPSSKTLKPRVKKKPVQPMQEEDISEWFDE